MTHKNIHKHFKQALTKIVRYLLWAIIAFVSVTLILEAGIFITLFIAQHNGKLDQWIKEATGWDLRYQAMHISWHMGHPSVVLDKVVFEDPKDKDSQFSIAEVQVDIALWPSVFARAPMTSQFIISGLNLNVAELPDEAWQVNNMIVGGPSKNSDILQEALNWLLSQKEIAINNLDLHIHFLNGHDYHFAPTNLSWYGKGHQFNLTTSVASMPKSKLILHTNFFPAEDVTNFSAWKVRFSGNANARDFSLLFADRSVYQLRLLSGGGRINFNGLIENGDLSQLHMGMSLTNLNLAHSGAHSIQLDEIDEELFWQSFGPKQGWSLRVQPVSGAASALGSSGSGALVVTYHPQDPEQTWSVNADDVDLGLVGEWIDFAFTSNQEIVKVWDLLSPEGTVTDLNLTGNSTNGNINFKGKNLTMDANDIFPQGWPPAAINFTSSWQEDSKKKNWAVQLKEANLTTDHLTLNVQGNLNIPVADPANPYLNLTADLQGKNLQEVRNYYIPQFEKGLATWLQQGLVSLPLVNAKLRWKGKLHDLPYADAAHPGNFKLEIDTNDAAILPWTDWPKISNLNAKLLFNNQRYTIEADNAETQGVTLHNLHFELKDMRPGIAKTIVITGNANPSGTQALNYLASMPVVSPSVQKSLKTGFQLSGSVPINLNIKIPLHKTTPASMPVIVDGTATFKANNFSRAATLDNSVLFKNITGVLNFENQYISGNNLNFFFKDLPCKVNIIKSPVNYLHLLIPEMHLYGQSYSAVSVFVQPPADNIQNVKNPLLTFIFNDPNAVGTAILHPDGTIEATMDRWIIQPAAVGAINANSATPDVKPTTTKKTKVDTSDNVPADYLKHLGQILSEVPPLELTVKAFTYGRYDLGSVFLQSNPMSDGIAIQHLTLGDNDAKLDVAGSIVTHNQQDEVSMAGSIEGNNFGAALIQLGHPGVVDGGNGTMKFEVNWFGALTQPDWSTMQGDITFDVGAGKFLKVNTGLAQIFGLLSLNTVVSTFSLDFKGIFSGGLSFNSISGSYNIHNGVANTENLALTGPTVDVHVKGDMDLVHQTIDQILVIKPQLSTSVALAATVIGGPIAGAATFVANELLNNTVLKNSGFVYHISGPIAKPKAEPVAAQTKTNTPPAQKS